MIIRCANCNRAVRTVDKISIFEDLLFCHDKCRAEWNMRTDLIDSGVDMDAIRKAVLNAKMELWMDGR